MLERFRLLNKNKADKSSPQKPPTQFEHKTQNRVAPKITANSFLPKQVANNKLPMKTRMQFVKKIYEELNSIKQKPNTNDLVEEALNIEKEICAKSKNLISIYKSSVVSKIRGFRKADQPVQANTSKSIVFQSDNCSIVKRAKTSYKDLSGLKLFTFLARLEIPEDELEKFGFPIMDDTSKAVKFPSDSKFKSLVQYSVELQHTCTRCGKLYTNPQKLSSIHPSCIYHPGKIFKFRSKSGWESQYSCCKNDSESGGCSTSTYHVTDGFHFLDSHEGFVTTFEPEVRQVPKVYALDCEMVLKEAFHLISSPYFN